MHFPDRLYSPRKKIDRSCLIHKIVFKCSRFGWLGQSTALASRLTPVAIAREEFEECKNKKMAARVRSCGA